MTDKLRQKISERHNLGGEYKRSLEGVKTGILEINNPQTSYKSVHVTASNGAGSTSEFVALALENSGYRVGKFSGSNVTGKGIREKYRVNGEYISKSELLELSDYIAENVKTRDEWDFLVLMALQYFRQENVDVAVFEAGIGGKNDSTNVISAELCLIPNAITSSNHPHLGETDVEVAKNKAGIIHENSVAVSNGTGEVNKAIENVSDKRGAEFYRNQNPIEFRRSNRGTFNAQYGNYKVSTDIFAGYLCDNINTAVTGLEKSTYNINKSDILSTVKNYSFPGRCQYVKGEPSMLIDCARNEFSARALRNSYKCRLDNVETLIFNGVDEYWEEILDVLEDDFSRIIIPNIKQKYMTQNIKICRNVKKAEPADNIERALDVGRNYTDDDGIIIITGSITIVKEALNCLDF